MAVACVQCGRQGPFQEDGFAGRRFKTDVAGDKKAIMSAASVLEITGLTIRRGNTAILREVSWRVERGQHWAILGANGSGKTSLLSALTGYFMPTAGEIVLLG